MDYSPVRTIPLNTSRDIMEAEYPYEQCKKIRRKPTTLDNSNATWLSSISEYFFFIHSKNKNVWPLKAQILLYLFYWEKNIGSFLRTLIVKLNSPRDIYLRRHTLKCLLWKMAKKNQWTWHHIRPQIPKTSWVYKKYSLRYSLCMYVCTYICIYNI